MTAIALAGELPTRAADGHPRPTKNHAPRAQEFDHDHPTREPRPKPRPLMASIATPSPAKNHMP